MTTLRYSPPEGCYELQMKFTNHRGERLVGTLVSTSTSRDVVLLCHGSQANQSMVRFPALAYELAAAGLGSFRFDHPCAWGSDSQRKGPFQIGNHADEVEDMKAAIKFLKIKGKKVVAMLGHSKGGMNVMMYAATVGDVPKVVNLSGLYHVKERMAREVSQTTQTYTSLQSFDMCMRCTPWYYKHALFFSPFMPP